MKSEPKQCKVVGSVPNWQTWCSVAEQSVVPCDWVELRADSLPVELSLQQVLTTRPAAPVLLTVRHRSEGGLRDWLLDEREQVALQLLPMATALDWEIAQWTKFPQVIKAAKEAGVLLIASHHNFEKTPTLRELQQREQEARAAGADVVKFAFRLNAVEDMMVGVELLRQASGPMAVMGMGSLGPVSRLLYAQHGSCLIYGYMGDAPTAPGQWSAEMFTQSLNHLPLL